MKKLFFIFVLICAGCALKSSIIQPAPIGGKAVIFDIDGTLTPRPMEIWGVRTGAANAVRRYSDTGYQIIYLSARTPMFQSGIPAWLSKNGFPAGLVLVPESSNESGSPAEYKTKMLGEILSLGWSIEAAYGDSSTDFEAYSAVGIPRTSVYALKREGAGECETGAWSKCLDGWRDQDFR